eukprot:COSAG05_NODE_20382_length_280_cov_0.569061_1_plen_63_part_01
MDRMDDLVISLSRLLKSLSQFLLLPFLIHIVSTTTHYFIWNMFTRTKGTHVTDTTRSDARHFA